jgi:predicted DNA-binding protein
MKQTTTTNKDNKVFTAIRLDADQLEKLQELSTKNERNVSYYVRQAVKQFIQDTDHPKREELYVALQASIVAQGNAKSEDEKYDAIESMKRISKEIASLDKKK